MFPVQKKVIKQQETRTQDEAYRKYERFIYIFFLFVICHL